MTASINRIAVLGLGNVGTLVATLLAQCKFAVTGFDLRGTPSKAFPTEALDSGNAAALSARLKDFDAVISCLPFNLNKGVANVAHKLGIHYFDLTEDVDTTKHIADLAATSKGAMIPQCGLAPGFIGIVASSLARSFDGTLRSIEMRVGALPVHPRGILGYAFNWSPEGVINEYLKECEVIHHWKKSGVPPLQHKETLVIDGVQLEAFTTSGGLGTMCDTFEGKVKTLDYKSIRYPGHCDLMKFFLEELHMDEHFDDAVRILTNAKPPVDEDVVYIHAAVEGMDKGRMLRREYVRSLYPIEIGGRMWTAIAWTTAASAVAVIEMVRSGVLPAKGFVRQEDIPLDKFLATECGRHYEEARARHMSEVEV